MIHLILEGRIPMVSELPKRIHPQVDYPIIFQCGCRVTFLGSCFHHTSRMECCAEHNSRSKSAERNELRRRAKEQYEIESMFQPPKK